MKQFLSPLQSFNLCLLTDSHFTEIISHIEDVFEKSSPSALISHCFTLNFELHLHAKVEFVIKSLIGHVYSIDKILVSHKR